jgi:hypothetical protein
VLFCRSRDKDPNVSFLHLDLTPLKNGRSQADFLISNYFPDLEGFFQNEEFETFLGNPFKIRKII